MVFKDLNVTSSILRALENEKYTTPTPIQEQTIPIILSGRDVLGCAQTGTGKTAAFAVPTLQNLCGENGKHTGLHKIRALVLSPTRELALQIHDNFCAYGRYTGLRSCAIYGGVSQYTQERTLKRGVDIVVATPGRLNDLMNQGIIDLSLIQILILDEVDRMLDMGFIHDVKKIISKTPQKRQTLLFSATMPPEIVAISDSMLNDPIKISITPDIPMVEAIEQSVYFVDKVNKRKLLLHLLENPEIGSVLVFTRTKYGADGVVRELVRGNIQAQAIHGDKSQSARQQALRDFKNKVIRVLVATDIAARGFDIDGLTHVINFDLPEVPETYIHRIGRTGRAGNSGIAISFCSQEEKRLLEDIKRKCRKPIPVVSEHPYPLVMTAVAATHVEQRRRKAATKPAENKKVHSPYGNKSRRKPASKSSARAHYGHV